MQPRCLLSPNPCRCNDHIKVLYCPLANNDTDLKKPLTPVFEKVEIQQPPAELNPDPFYQKYVDAGGIAVISSEKTNDEALLVAAAIVNYMLQKREDIRTELIKRKCKVRVMAPSVKGQRTCRSSVIGRIRLKTIND